MDTTPPPLSPALMCNSMIRPLLPGMPVLMRPVVAPVISTVMAPAGWVAPASLANFTGIRWILPAR